MSMDQSELSELLKQMEDRLYAKVGRWLFAILGALLISAALASAAWTNTNRNVDSKLAERDFLQFKAEYARTQDLAPRVDRLEAFKDDQLKFNVEQARLIMKIANGGK